MAQEVLVGLAKGHMDPKWLKDELSKRPHGQAGLASFLGYDPSKVNRMCSGARQVKAGEADKIREYLALTSLETNNAVASIRHASQPRVQASLLPVRGVVEAGSWREVAYQEVFPPETVKVQPGDVGSDDFALKVQGPSMDLYYPSGSHVIVRPCLGEAPQVGKHVVVERERDGLVETTLKELVRDHDGKLELWPRSRHPAFQAPVPYDDAEDSRVRIIGVVTHAIIRAP
jgi:SOS-response transcriptional repressor LexA